MTEREMLADLYGEDLLFMDGYDDCILGVAERFGMETVVAYDKNKIVEKMMNDGMDWREAGEFISYNQLGAWAGEKTPVFVSRFSMG